MDIIIVIFSLHIVVIKFVMHNIIEQNGLFFQVYDSVGNGMNCCGTLLIIMIIYEGPRGEVVHKYMC